MNRKFFTYMQNNSGGSFEIDDDVAKVVVIEAVNAVTANDTAVNVVGIYFDGCDKGIDCECCGDRWNPMYDDYDGTDTPTVYGQPLNEYKDMWSKYAVVWSYDDNGQLVKNKVYYGTNQIGE